MISAPCRAAASFDDIYQIEHTGLSTYDGLAVSLARRLANELEWSASYTYSRARDDASDFDEQPQEPGAFAVEQPRRLLRKRYRLRQSAGCGPGRSGPGSFLIMAARPKRLAGNIWCLMIRARDILPGFAVISDGRGVGGGAAFGRPRNNTKPGCP